MSIGDQHVSETFEGHGIIDPSPFVPQVEEIFFDQSHPRKGNFKHYEVTFNQAYILDSAHSGDLLSRRLQAFTEAKPIVGGTSIEQNDNTKREQGCRILNMDHAFEHVLDEDEEWPLINYGVEVIYNRDNLMVRKATFTGITGVAAGGNIYFPKEGDYIGPIFADEDSPELFEAEGTYQGWATGYFPVCKMVGGEVITFTLRDNLHIGQRQVKAELSDVTGDSNVATRYAAEVARRAAGQDARPRVGGTGQAMLLMKEGNQAGAEAGGQVFPENIADKDYKPMSWRGLIAGSGISVSPYLDSIIIDSTGASDGLPWSGQNCGRDGSVNNEDADWATPQGHQVEDGPPMSKAKNVYKAYTANQDGTHANPAIFRRLSGAGSVDVDYDAGQDCIIRISGGIVEAPWSGQNCGRDEDGEDADWAMTQGVNANHSRAKNVYKAYHYADGIDGTRDQPAIFRRLSGDKRGNSKTLAFENGGVIVDYDESEDCLIMISGHIWSGMNCVKAGADQSEYDGKAFNVYVENWGENDGIRQNPAIFRRLSGDGQVTVKYDSVDDCLISISGECCSGVENAGSIPATDAEGARVYSHGNNPAILRRLIGKELLANENGDTLVTERGADFIDFTAIWTGRSHTAGYGTPVYQTVEDGTVAGSLANPATFYTLKGEAGVEVNLRNDAFGIGASYVEISGSRVMNTGIARSDGACDYGAKVYIDEPETINPFVFRTLTGRYDTSDAANWQLNGGRNQINVRKDGNLVRIEGNNQMGKISMPATLTITETLDEYGYQYSFAEDGYVQVTWRDGLISGLESSNSSWQSAQTGSFSTIFVPA